MAGTFGGPPRRAGKQSSGPLIIVAAVIFLAVVAGAGLLIYNLNQTGGAVDWRATAVNHAGTNSSRRGSVIPRRIPTTR